MLDGVGHVAAVRSAGFEPAGRRALVVGAGGAGTAIAHALADAEVGGLAIHDRDHDRRDHLIGRIAARGDVTVEPGSDDTRGFDLVTNATPMGMRPDDPLPIDVRGLRAGVFVSDVVTAPAVPPLIESARALGCPTLTGTAMFRTMRHLIADFYWR